MSSQTLELQLSTNARDRLSAGVYTLEQVVPASPRSPLQSATFVHFASVVPEADLLLHNFGGGAHVYRGTITALVANSEVRLNAICKIAIDSEDQVNLEREKDMYITHLDKFQGAIVPYFHGMFWGDMARSSNQRRFPVSCMILEDVGRVLVGKFSDQPMACRKNILEGLLKLHSAGIRHDDFCESNVLIGESNNIRIVDFDQARLHKCPSAHVTLDDLGIDGWEVQSGVVSCLEVLRACERMDIWIPATIPLSGSYFFVEDIRSHKDLARKAARTFGKEEASLLEDAKKIYELFIESHEDRLRAVGFQGLTPAA
ncbi:unnamed protein product [Somion occarium]|uniref:Non-specific serine/threonine protein kinase n=1 Tax=Somion occarium TaxID=3059160 RepID=A0ABP1E5B6_9APHY